MGTKAEKRRAVEAAVKAWPGSPASLAAAVGVAHTTLRAVRRGDWEASPELMAALARTLDGAATRCQKAATTLRGAQ